MPDADRIHGPIFIVGAARSGTTLLQYMLRSHPNISLPTAESHFFIPFYKRRVEFGDLKQYKNLYALIAEIYQSRKLFFTEELHGINIDLEIMTKLLHNQGCYTVPDVIAGIFKANAKAEGKERWGDKTPYYILHLNTLLEMFPDAQFVHIIRDGRDCALSMLKRRQDLKIFNIYHAAYTWQKYVVAGLTFGDKHRDCYFQIRYEDILDQPKQSMHGLCSFLNVPYNDALIEFRKAIGNGNKTPLLTKPIQKSNQSKWQSIMMEKDLAVFEGLAGKTLAANGYTLACSSPSISSIDRVFYEIHIKWNHIYSKYFQVK
ncbi:MAG: sulfotransferase [Planctomycetes bacterium]|nr:sulfotransferase [Planctomycetota bacterium]